MQLPAGRGELRRLQQPADRHAVHTQIGADAEVRQHEHAHRVTPPVTRLELPMPPFQPKQTIPVPAPTAPSATAADAAASPARGRTSSASTCDDAGVVQPAVVALADDRDHHGVDADRAARGHAAATRRRRRGPRHRRGEVDRRLDQRPIRRSGSSRQLARAVEHGHTRRDRLGPQPLDRSGQDRRSRPAGGSPTPWRGRPPRPPRPRSRRPGPAPARRCAGRARAGSSRRPWRDSTN